MTWSMSRRMSKACKRGYVDEEIYVDEDVFVQEVARNEEDTLLKERL